MHSRERVVGVESVVEFGVEPVGGGVANSAVAREAELDMRRIVAVEKVRGMAAIATCRRSLEHVVDVACSAGESGVRPGQRVAGVFQVVEFGVEPTVHGVAGLAGGGKSHSNVVQNRGKEVLLMAGVASGG